MLPFATAATVVKTASHLRRKSCIVMADERVDSKIVSQFLLNTCRLRPRLTGLAVQAALRFALQTHHFTVDDAEADRIPLITGSVAEFYIEPMLRCVGDIDVMSYDSSKLAIPRRYPPPTQLPAEFHNYVEVMEMFDSHLPGYVYLVVRYAMTYCPEHEKYHYVDYDSGKRCDDVTCQHPTYLKTTRDGQKNHHGPAVLTDNSHVSDMLSVDMVYCCRCLVWPPQAADWPARLRNYGWPDSATVEDVVGSGCDVVQVAHRKCRQDKWMNEHQWRLSFSRAEIVLINSWMPVQQVVYHMLRVFVKTERLTDSVDNSNAATLSNYHIKTLMLWAAELKPRSWWTDSLNLVKVCVKLLHTLSVWLTDRRCQHYFINDCNIMDDNTVNMQMIVIKLTSTNEARLSAWFVKNYIDKCAERCPDVVSDMRLQDVVSAVVDWRLASSAVHLWCVYGCAECKIQPSVSELSRTLRSFVYMKNMLAKMDERLTVYFIAVAFLDVSRRISSNGFSDKLMDILTALLGYDVDIPRYQKSSAFFSEYSSEIDEHRSNKICQHHAASENPFVESLSAENFEM